MEKKLSFYHGSQPRSVEKNDRDRKPVRRYFDSQKEKSVYNGYFEDEDVQDRSLSDWAGTWQSVDTYVEDGTFDPVFEYKEKLNQDKTAQEYKEYYTKGYQTDIASIKIGEKRDGIYV